MNPNIAFLTGGYSGEAVISYKSAEQIESNLDREKFNIYKIDIRTDGWFHTLPDRSRVEVNRADFTLPLPAGTVHFDGVFIGIHGTPGEDGKLQGYFDMLGIPYSSCDATTSALTFNKRYTVAVAAFAGLHVAGSMHLFSDKVAPVDEILAQVKLPVFVKPNNGGSSIGMSKVSKAEDLSSALDKAFKEDDQVLVEECVSGREFTVGLFRSQGEIVVLPSTEVISKNEFFDYEAKYQGASSEVTPAVLEEEKAQKVRSAASKAYVIFNCRGIVRMDFIFNEAAGEPYLLEINTVPGQSEASIVPQQVRAMGWTLKEFYTLLIEDCLPAGFSGDK